MNRQEIMDKLKELQNKIDSMGFFGQNEYDLHLRHEIADWIEKEFIVKANAIDLTIPPDMIKHMEFAREREKELKEFSWNAFNSPGFSKGPSIEDFKKEPEYVNLENKMKYGEYMCSTCHKLFTGNYDKCPTCHPINDKPE